MFPTGRLAYAAEYKPVLSNNEAMRDLKIYKTPLLLATFAVWLQFESFARSSAELDQARATAQQYCVDCHGADKASGGFNLEAILADDLPSHAEKWEQVLLRLRTRQMPPPQKKRPDENAYEEAIAAFAGELNRSYAQHPNPGRTDTFRRLNCTEYQNSIRDLLALEIDAAASLPKDEASHGFDNVTVGSLSPTLLDRYVTAAEKISRLAVGSTVRSKNGETYRVKPDVTQDYPVEGLPIGTRGGTLIEHTFPVDGEYEIVVRLARDRNEEVEGLSEPHQLELLIDDESVYSFVITPPKGPNKNWEQVDQHLKARLAVKAGPRKVGATFVSKGSPVLETRREPYSSHYNMHRHPRLGPAVYQVSINGPLRIDGVSETPSRRAIFTEYPGSTDDDLSCAKTILSRLMRRAYRRPVTSEDVNKALAFYQQGRDGGSFEAGIENALSSILVSPNFLFRIEHDPKDATAKQAYQLSDVELASRLSFFLWSSIPDDELLDLAEKGELHRPEVLEKQTRRMLADARALSLGSNFAGQWLYLRNLESITPDLRLYPDFDDNLRQALREETELFFQSVVLEDRSAVNLLKADYTFLNERLARHYGIPNVYGIRFRRVELKPEWHRGGLLRQGSVLTVTSYANRTSPVLRGHWILGNILGTPTPPPPPNVPALKEKTLLASLSVRQRLAEHRADAACAVCHNRMDPPGFALENFDAIGRWRELDEAKPVDASAGLPDGSEFVGVDGLEAALLKRPETFVHTFTEKLMTFALGRGIEFYDQPAVRQIVQNAKSLNYRFSDVIVGIVTSPPFTMRRAL